MPDGWTDPAGLDGDALTKWYLRSPADIEQERQAASDQRYQDFFYGLQRNGAHVRCRIEFGGEATSSRQRRGMAGRRLRIGLAHSR